MFAVYDQDGEGFVMKETLYEAEHYLSDVMVELEEMGDTPVNDIFLCKLIAYYRTTNGEVHRHSARDGAGRARLRRG